MPNVEQPPWAKLADGGDPWYEQGPEGITLPDELNAPNENRDESQPAPGSVSSKAMPCAVPFPKADHKYQRK